MSRARIAVLLAVLMTIMSVVAGGTTAAVAAELVMFESPGCPWCARWHAEVGPGYGRSDEGKRAPLRIAQLAQAAGSGVHLSAPIIASPTFVLVDSGREIGRIVGYPGADFFWGLLDQLVKKLDHPSTKQAL